MHSASGYRPCVCPVYVCERSPFVPSPPSSLPSHIQNLSGRLAGMVCNDPQAFAGFLAGRTAGKVFGPAAASRLGLGVVMAVGMIGAGATQTWLGLAGSTGAGVSKPVVQQAIHNSNPKP